MKMKNKNRKSKDGSPRIILLNYFCKYIGSET